MNYQLYDTQKKVISEIESDHQNALIVVPTGGGKTIIVAELFRNLVSQNQRCLFLVPTNVLVDQHYLEFKRIFGNDVSKIKSGVLEKPDSLVYICTAHYGKILLDKGIFSIEDFALVAMDEVHKASSETHPYVQIRQIYNPKRLIGASASLGSASRTKKVVKNLEIKKIVYGESPFSFKKEIVKTSFKPNKYYSRIKNYLDLVLTQNPVLREVLERACNMKHPSFNFRDYNVVPILLKNKFRIASTLNKVSKKTLFLYYRLFHILYCFYLYVFQDVEPFRAYYENVRVKYRLNAPIFQDLCESQEPNSKFLYLLELLESKPKTSTVMVFFENYSTAESFKRFLSSRCELKVMIVGGRSKMSSRTRDDIIARINLEVPDCVIATSVVEEGINVRSVDHVVIFTPVSDPVRFVQRKGRTGRYTDGKVEILYYEKTFEENISKNLQ